MAPHLRLLDLFCFWCVPVVRRFIQRRVNPIRFRLRRLEANSANVWQPQRGPEGPHYPDTAISRMLQIERCGTTVSASYIAGQAPPPGQLRSRTQRAEEESLLNHWRSYGS